MQKINLVSLESYYSKESKDFISNIIKDSIYITDTNDIKNFRVQNLTLENSNCSLLTIKKFIQNIETSISNFGGYITISDQLIVMSETIKEIYGESDKAINLLRMKKQLFQLSNILLEKNIERFDEDKLRLIQEKSTKFTAELFTIHGKFIENLRAVQEAKSHLLKFDNQEGEFPLYQEIFKQEITKAIKDKNVLIMEGALYFTQEKKQIIEMAYKLNKEIYLITKSNPFVNENSYLPLLEELNAKANYIELHGKDFEKKNNSIKTVAENLFINDSVDNEIDNSISFIEPFVNREEEYKFIIDDILKYLNTEEEYEKKINHIAVRLRSNKERRHFNELLKKTDTNLRIFVYENSLLDYSLGQFIFGIYNIINNGIDVDKYKKMLFTQWKYSPSCNVNHYNQALKDFVALETYFKKTTTVEEWIDSVNQIIDIKNEIENNDCYIYHPIYNVSKESLNFIKDHLCFIKEIVEQLSAINGTNSDHIEKLEEILANEIDEETEEEINKIFSILQKINDKSMLKVNSKYFSEALLSMISEFEFEEKNNEDFLYINTLDIDNFTKYKRVYVTNFELGKYPQSVEKEFPYTDEILNILKDEQIGIKYKLYPYIENDYNFFIKNYFDFAEEKIIFTQSESVDGNPNLPSTYVEDIFTLFNSEVKYESVNQKNDIPVSEFDFPYVYSNKIESISIPLANLIMHYVCPKMFYFLINTKTYYTDEVQLSLYASNILYVRFFENFVEKNKNKTFYLDINLQEETETILKETLKEIERVFYYLSPIELNDIYSKTLSNIFYFYKQRIRKGKFAAKHFSLSLEKSKLIDIDGCKIKIDKRLIVKNEDTNKVNSFDICKGLHYLLSKTKGREYEFNHFGEIKEKLELANSNDDRIKLADFAFFKIDVQLAGRFYDDGIIRIKSIMNKIKEGNHYAVPSHYCNFCKMKNSCKNFNRGII